MIFDVLSRELDVFAPYFLEASAGTGKTFAIEHLVTRLLIEGESSFSVDQILVVTFTRAATRELKKRIRNNLCRSKEELLSLNPATDYLKAICEKDENAVKEAVQKIEAALIDFDKAQIYTIHGFCYRILKEFAFEAGIGFGFSDPEAKEHLPILHQMIKDHLKDQISLPDYSPVQIKALLKKYKKDYRKIVSYLAEMIGSGKEITSVLNYGELFERFLKEMAGLQQIEQKRFKEDFNNLKSLYKQMKGIDSSQIDLFSGILESKKCNQSQFDSLLKEEFFLKKMVPENLKVKAKIPSSLHYPGLFDHLRQVFLPVIEKAKDPSFIFLRLAQDLKKKSQMVLEKEERFLPDDLLLKVKQATENPDFIEKIRQKYRAAIIDEFQDTDPIQWTIFQKLFLGHLKAVCLVGDPKQAIYAFRSADVYTYLDAAKAMGKTARRYLDTNYRSTSRLVDALNSLFSKTQGGWMTLPQRKEELNVIPVKSKASMESDESEIPIQFFIAEGKRGRSQKFPTQEMLEKQIFPFIASEIHSLNKNGVDYQNISILVKDRYQGKEIVEYLKKRGIPVYFKQSASMTDSVAYFALKEILDAVSSPYNLSKVKAALGGPLIRWNEEQLRKSHDDPSLLQAKAQMQFLRSVLFEKGFGIFFQMFLNSHWSDSDSSLLQEILSRGELSLYLDLRKLSELILEETQTRYLKGAKILDFLSDLAMDPNRDENRLMGLSQEEKTSVVVMTMHKSKGLEFDTVFALAVASRHKPSEHLTIRNEDRSTIAIFDADDPACQLALEEQDAEKMRGLYVALTRAKKRLYVPVLIDKELKPLDIGEASPIELFFAKLKSSPVTHQQLYTAVQSMDMDHLREILESLSPQISYRILDEVPDLSFVSTAQTAELSCPGSFCFPSYDDQIYSFTALAKSTGGFAITPKDAIESDLEFVLSPHTMPIGNETGHLLHLLFEKIFKRKIHCPLDENALQVLINEEMAFSSLDKFRPIMHSWILELLRKKISNFSLADVPGNQVQQEMEFLFPISKGMMKGFCDLLFEFEGKYYLLDWKSNYLGTSDKDYGKENIARAMQEHNYFLQASIYAAALKRFVKLFDNRPFSECFGGAIYYFVRGKAVLHFTPEPYEDQ